jgi:hypothetical protein
MLLQSTLPFRCQLEMFPFNLQLNSSNQYLLPMVSDGMLLSIRFKSSADNSI